MGKHLPHLLRPRQVAHLDQVVTDTDGRTRQSTTIGAKLLV
jgi:hypothetical protein